MHNVAFHLLMLFITSLFRTGQKKKEKHSFQLVIHCVTDLEKSMLKNHMISLKKMNEKKKFPLQ